MDVQAGCLKTWDSTGLKFDLLFFVMGNSNSQEDKCWELSREKFRLIISATAFVGSERIRGKFTDQEVRDFLHGKKLSDGMIDEAY